MNENDRSMVIKAIFGLIVTLITLIITQHFYGDTYSCYIATIGAILTFIFSEAYLLPFKK